MNTYLQLLERASAGAPAPAYLSTRTTIDGCLDLSLGQIVGDYDLPSLNGDESPVVEWSCGYPPPRGDPKLIAAYLAYLSRISTTTRGCADVTPSNVLVTQGGKHALWLAFCLLIKPGVRVMLPRPGWAPYRLWAEALGALVSTYQPDDDGYREALDAASAGQIDAMVICSPNNPTAHELSPQLAGELLSVLDARGVSAIFDDVYHALSKSGTPTGLLALRSNAPVLMVDSLSKSLGAAGLRIGFLVGPSGLVSQALQIHGLTLSGVSSASQAIAARALTDGYDRRLAMTRQSVASRRSTLRAALERQAIPIHSAGGMYLWLPPSPHIHEDQVEINGTRLRGASGLVFGMPGYLRLCATSVNAAALQRLSQEGQ